MKHCRQAGFTLIAAIFLLVVVAGLVVYMANARVVQQTTLLYGVLGARATQAARSGIEWGIAYHLEAGNPCATNTFTPAAPALNRFTVQVSCVQSSHTEGAAPPIITYQLTALAEMGSFGSLDYIKREVRSTVSLSPP